MRLQGTDVIARSPCDEAIQGHSMRGAGGPDRRCCDRWVAALREKGTQRANPKAHPRSQLRISEILFLKIRSRGTLFVRPPRTKSAVAMLSQKSHRRMSSPPRASRGGERARAAVAIAARGDARFRERDAALQASGSRRRRGGNKNFPPCKPLKTNETELESRQIILPRSEEADATAATISPNQKESRRRVHPRRRWREARGPANAGRRNFPIRKPLKRLKTAKESRRLSRGLELGVQGKASEIRFHLPGSAGAGMNSP